MSDAMRVCFDITPALGQGAGIARYARELAIALRNLQDGPSLTLFHNRQRKARIPQQLHSLPRVAIPLGNRAWRLFLMAGLALPPAWNATINACDVFHGTDALIPWRTIPSVMTIHDLSTHRYPQHHTRLHRQYARMTLPRMAKQAMLLIADSTATKRDIVDQLGVPDQKVRVIPLGVDHQRFRPIDAVLARRQASQFLPFDAPYILSVGTLEPRKNLAVLLHAFALLQSSDLHLVLAGGTGWGDNPFAGALQQAGVLDRVHITGYVPDDLLPSLYAAAECFVYPSLYEGFGLPVLEAMACGAPVITSNTSSLPEVAGDAAILVDPTDSAQLAMKLRELTGDANMRSRLSKLGPAQAAGFTWERTARETYEVYRSIAPQYAASVSLS
ncbi:MAG: glycosyltransferase family 4 protein [Chloroflexi bacterium]|nr:glycosyltransferase family 4 protein [Chloroflexota bacterium]MCL5274160.1 glycosyltransferase family 4 protein [Chloroflexota bacterium]